MNAAAVFVRFFLVLLAALLPCSTIAVNVTLGWNPSTSPNIAGYNVHYGLASGNYTVKVPAGTNTSARITGLVEGQTYYFVVTVYNTAGIESIPSNEVGYTIPGVAAPGSLWIQTDPVTGSPVLKWNASPSPNVAGYKIYYHTTNGSQPELVFSGNATSMALSNLAQATNGYFVVTAYNNSGQESTNTTSIVSTIPSTSVAQAPVLSLKQTSAAGLPNVFSVTASGAIPQTWALEASTDLHSWGTVTTGSNTTVNVTVAVSPNPKMFFRLDSSTPGVQLTTEQPTNAYPRSFSLKTAGAAPATWTVQTSADLQNWTNLVSGGVSGVNVAVVPSKTTALFFRLKNLNAINSYSAAAIVAAPGNPWMQTDPATGSPVLKWSASPGTNVVGYKVYYGTANGSQPYLVYDGGATSLALAGLAQATNGYFVVTAYDSFGSESTNSTEIFGTTSPNSVAMAPVLSLKQTPVAGLPDVFSVTASGAIPQSWALEASADLHTWGTVTTGSNSAVNVSVVVSPKPKLFFRLDRSTPDVHLITEKPANAFPQSFSFKTAGAAPAAWTVQTSEDLQSWTNLVTGNLYGVNVAVVPSKTTALFFRLKSQ